MDKKTKKKIISDKRVCAKQAPKISANKCNVRKITKASTVPKQSLSKKKIKKATTRTNHSNCPIFRKAVETWFIPKLRLSKEKSEHARLCRVEECHIDTFLKYVKDDPTKRRVLGRYSGRPSKVDEETTKALIQHCNCVNNDELTNTKIAKKLFEIMPKPTSMSLSAARDFVRKTFKKKFNEKKAVKTKKKRETKHQKLTPQHSKQQYSWFSRLNFRRPWWKLEELDDLEGFRRVPLPEEALKQLPHLVGKHVNKKEKKQDVFSCDPDTHKRLPGSQRNEFTRLNKDSFTDGKRKLQNIRQGFITEEEVIKIQATLLANLDVAGYDIEEPVLLTTEESTETIFRQQLHKDFPNGSKSMFVIIPLCDDQTLYYEKNRGISSITLSKDCAFVGHASLIHAGSEKPGNRLHFKLIPKGQVEDTKTYFVDDSLYPGISGILEFE